MAIAPEKIADQEFQVGLRGYDRDQVRKFLSLVADDYRAVWEKSEGPTNGTSARDATAGPSSVATEPASPHTPTPSEVKAGQTSPPETTSPEVWAQMGDEVAAILQAAHEQAAALKRKAHQEAANAKAEAAVTRSAAETYAADLLTKAETAAESLKARTEAELKEAKKALAHAQNEALSLVADTDRRAKQMLQATERKARALPDEMLAEARNELTHLTQSQQHLYQWLETTRNHITEAIGTHQSTVNPDLTEPLDLTEITGDKPPRSGQQRQQRTRPSLVN